MGLLLAVVLCSLFAVAAPVSAEVAPAPQSGTVKSAEQPAFTLIAGSVVSGEVEGVLQLDRAPLTPLLQAFLHTLYPQPQDTAQAPHSFPASKGDCGLHTILTKGP